MFLRTRLHVTSARVPLFLFIHFRGTLSWSWNNGLDFFAAYWVCLEHSHDSILHHSFQLATLSPACDHRVNSSLVFFVTLRSLWCERHRNKFARLLGCFFFSFFGEHTCHTWVIAWGAWCQRSYIRSKERWKCRMQSVPGWWSVELSLWSASGPALAKFEDDSWIIKLSLSVIVRGLQSLSSPQGADAELLHLSLEHMFSLRDRSTWIKQEPFNIYRVTHWI